MILSETFMLQKISVLDSGNIYLLLLSKNFLEKNSHVSDKLTNCGCSCLISKNNN